MEKKIKSLMKKKREETFPKEQKMTAFCFLPRPSPAWITGLCFLIPPLITPRLEQW